MLEQYFVHVPTNIEESALFEFILAKLILFHIRITFAKFEKSSLRVITPVHLMKHCRSSMTCRLLACRHDAQSTVT